MAKYLILPLIVASAIIIGIIDDYNVDLYGKLAVVEAAFAVFLIAYITDLQFEINKPFFCHKCRRRFSEVSEHCPKCGAEAGEHWRAVFADQVHAATMREERLRVEAEYARRERDRANQAQEEREKETKRLAEERRDDKRKYREQRGGFISGGLWRAICTLLLAGGFGLLAWAYVSSMEYRATTSASSYEIRSIYGGREKLLEKMQESLRRTIIISISGAAMVGLALPSLLRRR